MEKQTMITGASGEIGAAIAMKLASEGHQLFLHYNQNNAAIEELSQQLPEDCIKGVIQADLSSGDGLRNFLEQIPNEITHLVMTSGAAYYGLFQDMKDEEMDAMLHLHVTSPWKITRAIIPEMIRRKCGNIILITSIWGQQGASCEVAYSSVKGAQNTFIKALAKELGPSQIYVNGVSPGFIDTRMNHHLTDTEKQQLVEDIPLQRAGLPEDVAGAVSFLCSDQSSYIQGEVIGVNGAFS
ncbi:elongation factor P 5-aminopentanone reductase [Gracilibacillus salinarum]|uniref:SDR family oxidoreductase n=1 Tax=Gracilibacillus salinarum TaxID=2932255 RepID=A0ABY4GPI6_9BACI|nr:SDR family oxidoreductase [Gracilibacillus salinarum]UOQ85637.1 SDR family oxidoreductase [Gracilibacillus salinarum]